MLETGNMDTLFWIVEYGKVFGGYFLLMFLWSSVVFGGHLRKKTFTYRFAFCVTVTVVIVNIAVLFLGLFHILDPWIIRLVFYGTFIAVLLKRVITYLYTAHLEKEQRTFPDVPAMLRGRAAWILSLLENYGLLVIVLIWGMVYFSYGAFQVHSYGYGDLYVHHEWIHGLMEGKIFSAGVYPEAMHCFIYCMSVLFDIKVFSILLFLQGIHAAVFMIAAYCLLRNVFHSRHTPVFVLAMFLTLDLSNADLIHSMFRLQITMPLEFGLHTVCLSALYLTKYLHHDRADDTDIGEKRRAWFCWDENLFLFMMSLAASLMIHFHVVLMNVLVCAAFAVFALARVFHPRRFVPLLATAICACLVSAVPMAAALKEGIPFHESIYWAVEVMRGETEEETQESQDGQAEEENDGQEEDREEAEEGEGEETPQVEQKGVNVVSYIRDLLTEVYENGYIALYGAVRARWIAILTIAAVVICIFGKCVSRVPFVGKVSAGYPPVIMASFLYAVVYAAPMLGLPDIIPEGRFFAPGHMMLIAVTAIPIDILFSLLGNICNSLVMCGLSFLSVVGIYGTTKALDCFRGYLYYEMTRYNSVVAVTDSIIDTFPRHSYTIISPTDELYQVAQDGWHEELLSFMEKCGSGEEYTIPSEYVFIYVEKKPILYAQSHFFHGPEWLAEEKYQEPYWEVYSLKYPDSGMSQSPEIIAAEVSEEEAAKDIPEYVVAWDNYRKFDRRVILESKAYEWCKRFAEKYPSVFDVYYEDGDFVCYYLKQNAEEGLYDFGKE